MSKDEKATRDRIHEIARLEFLDKGFQGASLRNIVKEAGVTTGSFYWYYCCSLIFLSGFDLGCMSRNAPL